MPDNVGKQLNIVSNEGRSLIFFEGYELCYNYRTGQWSAIPAYDTLGFFTINSKTADVGIVRYSGAAVQLQEQTVSASDAQSTKLTTAAPNINQGGRAVVTGVRPIVNGGTYSIRVGVQDVPADAVSWSPATAINSRSGAASFRSEGRYLRAELTITGGFTAAVGAEIEFSQQGRV